MANISLLDQFYAKETNALEFHYNHLRAPAPLQVLCPPEVDASIYYMITNLKYNGKIKMKYNYIDNALKPFGWTLLGRGTNRCVYKHLQYDNIVLKVGIDKAGATDAPAEFYNQSKLAPFCAKCFEVSPSGNIGLFERVEPIIYKDELKSIASDIFDVITKCIIGKYVIADIGTKFYMNWGLRKNFGPVLLDYPYLYEVDGNKLTCRNLIHTPYGDTICNGEIDYDQGFNHLFCEKCHKQYFARDLRKLEESCQIVTGGLSNMSIKIIMNGKEVKGYGVKDNETPKKVVNPSRMIDSINPDILSSAKSSIDKVITQSKFIPKENKQIEKQETVKPVNIITNNDKSKLDQISNDERLRKVAINLYKLGNYSPKWLTTALLGAMVMLETFDKNFNPDEIRKEAENLANKIIDDINSGVIDIRKKEVRKKDTEDTENKVPFRINTNNIIKDEPPKTDEEKIIQQHTDPSIRIPINKAELINSLNEDKKEIEEEINNEPNTTVAPAIFGNTKFFESQDNQSNESDVESEIMDRLEDEEIQEEIDNVYEEECSNMDDDNNSEDVADAFDVESKFINSDNFQKIRKGNKRLNY